MTFEIELITAPDAQLRGLSRILTACVDDGASVGFLAPMASETADRFWQTKIFPAVTAGDTLLWGAWVGGQLCGTVQLAMAQPENQRHRADVGKLLVHPEARRRGIARALMEVLIAEAEARRKSLLVLDTRSGDPSQSLYESLGFKVAGQIPAFCRNPHADVLEPTTYLYKSLG